MPPAGFRFASGQTANGLVAGVPAAARLARAFAEALPGETMVLNFGNDGILSDTTRAEIARLAPGLNVNLVERLDGPTIPAEALPDVAAIAALWNGTAPIPSLLVDPAEALRQAGRAIIRATAKPGDGVVSRHLNRRLSQAASALLLRFGWVRPNHATGITALIALAMFACLLTGTPSGLIAGAVLFQLASVADGIDGEIARATFRTSPRGASLDSAIDGLTNVGFLLGTGINFLVQGKPDEGWVSLAGAAVMGIGLVLLGWRALRQDGYIHFDGLKRPGAGSRGSTPHWLKALTSRDFYCLFLLVMALAGLLALALKIVLGATTIWLMVVLRALVFQRDRETSAP
jgi:CDP-L-myo-inositol myo-inositolphosphotransferase